MRRLRKMADVACGRVVGLVAIATSRFSSPGTGVPLLILVQVADSTDLNTVRRWSALVVILLERRSCASMAGRSIRDHTAAMRPSGNRSKTCSAKAEPLAVRGVSQKL